MTRKKILGSHVKRLLSGVSDHGRKHLTEVETDLVQTGILLEEAIEKLSFNFMAIHAAVAAQQDTIAMLLEGGVPPARHLRPRQSPSRQRRKNNTQGCRRVVY